jgi:hypothetical protein
LAAGKRGLKRGLKGRLRTVRLMLDETIVTETPPLYCCYGRIGEQVRVPITGNRAKRILHGAINVGSGDVVLLITAVWEQEEHQAFLSMVRGHWRGWNIVLFEDRAPQHKAPASREWADSKSSLIGQKIAKQHKAPASREWAERLGIEVRLLPKATPELNAMDHLWRHTKREILSDRPPGPIDQAAQEACDYILAMSPQERLRRAGVLSGNFWLQPSPCCQRTFG